MNYVGTTFWITGLSGAGKTTIGKILYEYMAKKNNHIILLDGDILRDVYKDYTYTTQGRIDLTYRNARLCKMLNDQGIDVIICCIAMYDECREWNRNNIKNYKEIYLNVPIDELIKRDQKKLYSRALNNELENVMGINLAYESPKCPDLEINNSGFNTPKKVLNIIIEKFNL